MVAETFANVTTESDELLTGRPFPGGVRDLGDRTYEAADEWSRSLITVDSDEFTADQHAALAAQAVTEAESTISNAFSQACDELRQRFPGSLVAGHFGMTFDNGQVRTRWGLAMSMGERSFSGQGTDPWAAFDDLCAQAAAELPVAGRVA